MRILMLAQSYAPVIGGEEQIVQDLSTELISRGHEVSLATLRQPAGEPTGVTEGLRVHLLGSLAHRIPGMPENLERRYAPPAPDPKTALQLRRLVSRERPDVVHAHNWLLHSYLPLDRRSGPALVLSMHDYGLVCATKRLFYRGGVCSGPGTAKCVAHAAGHYGTARGPVIALGVRATEPWLRRRVDMFLSISGAVGSLCEMPEDETHRVIPNFVRALPPPPPSGDDRLRDLPDGPFVLFFGDATEDKGAQHLLDVYRTLDGVPPLVFVGRRFVGEEESPSPNVRWLGPMPHAHAIEAVRRSLFTVAPSLWAEPFGLVALESAAAGKPVVASDIGGLSELVIDGETGLLVPPGDREALRAALLRMFDDGELRARMGDAAIRRTALFGPETVVPQVEEAYRQAVETRRSRRGRKR